MSKWFSWYWYAYLFAKQGKYDRNSCGYWARVWCRMRGHPNGPIFYTSHGLEPDNHCKDCGDEI